MSKKYHPLTEWALAQQVKWKGLKESDKDALKILKQYNNNIGTKFNPSDHWSAITIENARMAANGFKSVKEAKEAGVNLSHKSHSGYVNDGFKAVQDPDYKYNKYISERIDDSEIKIGDYLVGGRESTKNWKFEDFEKAAKNNSGYESHGSAVVYKSSDDKGEYVILADGNWDDTYANRKVYVKDLAKKGYAVKVTDTKPPVTEALSSEEKHWSPLDISIARAENDLKTNLEGEDPILDEDTIQDEDITNINNVEQPSQAVYSQPRSKNKFRLSDSDQMALFGSILYPATSQSSAKQIVSNYTGGQEEEQDADEKWQPKAADISDEINEINETLDSDIPSEQFEEDLENPFESLDAEQSGSTDEKTYGAWRDMTEDEARKLYGRGSYKKDPYISYLDGDITKEEYQKYLRTTSEFKKDFDKVENILSGYRERLGKPTKNSVGGISYILTSDQIKNQRKIAKDFADKYGYSTEGWITDKEFVQDEARDMLNDGLFKSKGLQQDVKKYTKEYADFNRLKDGFTEAGFDVDDEGNISFNGKIETSIENIIEEEKAGLSKFDFNANDGKGAFVVTDERQLAIQYQDEQCAEEGLHFIPHLGRCGTYDEANKYNKPCPSGMQKDENGNCGCPPGQVYYSGNCWGNQTAGSADGFWAGTLLGPASVPGMIGTYIADAAAEIVLPPVIDPVIDGAFDLYDLGFGDMTEKYQAYEKYAQPVRSAAARYDKADGFLNGVNAFLGGSPTYWKEEGGSVGLGDVVDKATKEQLEKLGYTFEEI